MNSFSEYFTGRRWQRAGVLLSNCVIIFLWLWLFRPVYAYLGTIFTRQEFRTNQIVLLAVLVLIGLEIRRGRSRRGNYAEKGDHIGSPLPIFTDPVHLYLPGLVLALSGALAFLAAERWLDINTLSASLFGLATYGLLACWTDERDWRRGLPAALLLVGVLPFGEHMDTFIGYPLRLATARMVSQGLAALGVPNIGVDTILVFENGLSQIDSPCSGVKSLWTGGLFFLAATWIENRPVNKRWLLAALGFILLLVAANLARVVILVLVGQVLGWRLLAEMMHVPLGIIGFSLACAAALGMLHWAGVSSGRNRSLRRSDDTVGSGDQSGLPLRSIRPRWLAPVLAISLIVMALSYAPGPEPAAAAPFAWRFPSSLNLNDWPLNPVEMDWLSDEGTVPVSAARWRFQMHDLSGSLIFITSNTWRAHHRPERCFTVYGLEVQELRALLVEHDFPLRWLDLGNPSDPQPLLSAGYWLQSNQQVTDDYSVRIWDDLSPQPQQWVLVTILFDDPIDPDGESAQALFKILRQSVQNSLSAITP